MCGSRRGKGHEEEKSFFLIFSPFISLFFVDVVWEMMMGEIGGIQTSNAPSSFLFILDGEKEKGRLSPCSFRLCLLYHLGLVLFDISL